MFNYFNLAYLQFFVCLVVAILLVAAYRWFKWQPVRYRAAMTSFWIYKLRLKSRHSIQQMAFLLRFSALILIALAIGRPQIVDPKSKINVDGIDIMLVLDVSYSMVLFDDLKDQRMRLEIAKAEAIKFIERRNNDSIGLVLFGRQAVSRCPATLDREILRQIITQVQIGEIDPHATALSLALLTAINRLKFSHSASKVIILLTDGQPSQGDLDYQVVVEIAQKLGIKIYTIGIGSSRGGYYHHPVYGIIQEHDMFNQELLESIAKQTGGHFFHAENAQTLSQIYQTIDRLECTRHETNIFAKKFDLFPWTLLIACGLLVMELLVRYLTWVIA